MTNIVLDEKEADELADRLEDFMDKLNYYRELAK